MSHTCKRWMKKLSPTFCEERKCNGERNKKNAQFRKTLNCTYNFWENSTEGLVILKNKLKFPQDDRTKINFIAPLRMYFQRSESSLVNLKVFSMYSGVNCPKVPLNSIGMWTVTAINLKNKLTAMLLQMDFPQKRGELFSCIQFQTKSRGAQKCLALENHMIHSCCPV